MPAESMVASWRLNTAMSPGLGLPPPIEADCFLIRLGATPWRRSSARSDGLVLGKRLALDDLAALVLAFPDEGGVTLDLRG